MKDKIKILVIQKGKKMGDLLAYLRMSGATFYSKCETGKFNIFELRKIAKFCGVEMDELVRLLYGENN
jgi:hypothetical protein